MLLDDHPINLVEEGVDVAFRSGDLENSTLVARKIGQAKAVRDGHSKPYREARRTQDARRADGPPDGHLHRDGGGTSWTFRQGSRETSVPVAGRLKVTAVEGLREAVFADLGLGITSEWSFAPELAAGTVRPVLLDWDLPTLELRAVFPTGRMASAKTREFVSFVESCIPSTDYAPLRSAASA